MTSGFAGGHTLSGPSRAGICTIRPFGGFGDPIDPMELSKRFWGSSKVWRGYADTSDHSSVKSQRETDRCETDRCLTRKTRGPQSPAMIWTHRGDVVKFKIERLGGTQAMQQSFISETCANCASDAKCRRRDFSEQAWSVLVLWAEVQPATVDQPLCEDCYDELREVLIDRSDEIEAALADPNPVRRPAAQVAPKSKVAKGPAKVRKAS